LFRIDDQLTVAAEQCHQRDAASSISTFLTLAVTRFINHWKIDPSNTCNYIFISFVVQSAH